MWLLVISWRALLWWKVICFPEERPVPSFLPLLRHSDPPQHTSTPIPPDIHTPTQTHPHPGDPSNNTNCITCGEGGQRRKHSPVFYFFHQLHTPRLCVCMYVCMHVHCALVDFCWKYKKKYEDDSVSVALSPNSSHTTSAVYFPSAAHFEWTDLSLNNNQQCCCFYIVFALQQSFKVTVVRAPLKCLTKRRAVRWNSWRTYEWSVSMQMAQCCIVQFLKIFRKKPSKAKCQQVRHPLSSSL